MAIRGGVVILDQHGNPIPKMAKKSRSVQRSLSDQVKLHTPNAISVAGMMIYEALMLPQNKELQNQLQSYGLLDREKHSINIDELYKLPIPVKPKLIKVGGTPPDRAAAIKRCIILGLLALLLTVSTYVIQLHLDAKYYNDHCSSVTNMFSPSARTYKNFVKEAGKLITMTINPYQKEHCKELIRKHANTNIDLAENLGSALGDFKTRIALSSSIVLAISGLLSEGIKSIICLGIKLFGSRLDCGVDCSLPQKAEEDLVPEPEPEQEEASSGGAKRKASRRRASTNR
jgi:hypothetical protein